ncbi:hypothetical protein [Mucilaginibacter auburnensis]|uniref:Uncharacterized protein n=1 Tax=Mucilaginibacter auburnensis TaxID=1457233 RepID=A0A2H9VRI1_9SPHI|nr:hypothetical protein [Mucilaginibacter auburnensis]PJJ83424.1 hypothetical protein CLV57_0406 [Mucilaginibacter auburnensis]
MKENDIQHDLASIRSLMERSSKFISLSGFSGVLAGIYALIGAAVAYFMLYDGDNRMYSVHASAETALFEDVILIKLVTIAAVVLVFSISTGIILTYQKARRKSQPMWGKASKDLLFSMLVPLLSGGVLIMILLYRGYYGIVAPSTLIFYGLALISASNFTYTDVKFLGLCDVVLGLIAACLPGYGLVFWALGFGVLHIVYGSVMYFKYDR